MADVSMGEAILTVGCLATFAWWVSRPSAPECGDGAHDFELVEKRPVKDDDDCDGLHVIQRCRRCARIESEHVWD